MNLFLIILALNGGITQDLPTTDTTMYVQPEIQFVFEELHIVAACSFIKPSDDYLYQPTVREYLFGIFVETKNVKAGGECSFDSRFNPKVATIYARLQVELSGK